jgi:multidrug efflux pump subunit AcrB
MLAMLAVLAVFVPSFFMVGISRALFIPLSLAVGFAMLASFLLSTTLVPVLSTWLLRDKHATPDRETFFERAQRRYRGFVERVLRFRWPVLACYGLIAVAGVLLNRQPSRDRHLPDG